MNGPIAVLEESPMRGMQIRAVAVTGILSALDGFDVLAMTFAAPGIVADWGISKMELGLALSSSLVGMTLGSLLLAPLGDRIGRRPVGLGCLVLMGVGMFMSALSHSVLELACWRIVTGVGIGAMVPIIAPLAAEYANARYRRLAMAIMSIGYPIGGTVGGFAAAILLRHFEWPAVFFLGAALSGVMLVPAYLWMVETPAFLIGRRPRNALARLNAYLARCGQPRLEALPASPARGRPVTYRQLFAIDRRSATIRITAINLLFIVTVYYMLSWMPQLVAQQGHSASFATLVSATGCFSGAIVCVVLGLFGAHLPLRLVSLGTMVGLAAASVLFAAAGTTATTLLVLGALVGAFLYSGILALYSSIVATFDPEVRTTGVGFVMGVGRAAGAVAPTLAGLLFSWGFGPIGVTATLAAGALLAALLVLARNDMRPDGNIGR